MPTSWALLVVLTLAAGDPLLREAEQAYQEGELDAVLPALERALSGPLAPAGRVRAFELLALTHSAYERNQEAVEAFRRLLGEEPGWSPSAASSPKVLRLFVRAAELGAIPPTAGGGQVATAPAPFAPQPPPPAFAPSTPSTDGGLLRRWWFWAGVGVVAGAAGGSAYLVTRPQVPTGSLGTGALQR